MDESLAIVNPVKPRSAPGLGPVAVLAATKLDLVRLRRLMQLDEEACGRIHLSRLYLNTRWPQTVAVAGPAIGAPYAVMVLEALIARGATRIIFLGWCGALSADVGIGDLVLPQKALIEEGTSAHYCKQDGVDAQGCSGKYAHPSAAINRQLKSVLPLKACRLHEGAIWTTDAVYRETHAKVRRNQKAGILGVEMEFSALCSVARFRGVELGGLLVVSDELNQGKWQPGFKSSQFRQGRHIATERIVHLCRKLASRKPNAG